MRKIFYIALAVIISLTLLLVGYGITLNYTDEENIAVRLSDNVVRLEGARAERRALRSDFTKSDVRMEAENMTDAISRLEGTVEEIYVRQNERVRRGQPVCRIANEDVAMQLAETDVRIAQAETIAARYANSLARYQRLIGTGAVSLEQYEDVETQHKSAVAELKALHLKKEQYQLMQDRLNVRAPLEGEVLMLYKKQGAFLQAGTSVALIGNFQKLSFMESISDDEFQRLLPLGREWELTFAQKDMEKIYNGSYSDSNRGYEQTFKAHIINVEPPLAQAVALRKVQWEVDNSSGLLEPKRYQQVRFREAAGREVLAVPAAAVDGKQGSLFVWRKDGVLEERKVALGASDGSYTELLSGVEPGEIVIVSGRQGLKSGMKATVTIRGTADVSQ